MGQRLIRSIIIINNLKVEKLICDNPGDLKDTSYEAILDSI